LLFVSGQLSSCERGWLASLKLKAVTKAQIFKLLHYNADEGKVKHASFCWELTDASCKYMDAFDFGVNLV